MRSWRTERESRKLLSDGGFDVKRIRWYGTNRNDRLQLDGSCSQVVSSTTAGVMYSSPTHMYALWVPEQSLLRTCKTTWQILYSMMKGCRRTFFEGDYSVFHLGDTSLRATCLGTDHAKNAWLSTYIACVVISALFERSGFSQAVDMTVLGCNSFPLETVHH